MSLTVEAVYEDGVLKPAQPLPLPLKEHEKVTVRLSHAGTLTSSRATAGPRTTDSPRRSRARRRRR